MIFGTLDEIDLSINTFTSYTYYEISPIRPVGWDTLLTPAFGRQRQADIFEFKARLPYLQRDI